MAFKIAGVAGPHIAIASEAAKEILAEMEATPAGLTCHIHHTTYPYYVYADVQVTPADGAAAWWLSDRLMQRGIARVTGQSNRLERLIELEGAQGGAWRAEYDLDVPIVITGKVNSVGVVAGDVLRLSDWAIEDEAALFNGDAPRASESQRAWYKDTVKPGPRPATLLVALECVRCFRTARPKTRFRVETRDLTKMLCAAADGEVRCEVTSMWRGVANDHHVLLEDAAHVRGAVYVASEGIEAARFVEGDFGPLAMSVAPIKDTFKEYIGTVQEAGKEVSVATVLAISAYEPDVPWAEVRLLDDFMCATPSDFLTCLLWAQRAGTARYQPVVFENIPRHPLCSPVLHDERSLKWLLSKTQLVGETVYGEVLADVRVPGTPLRKVTLRVRYKLWAAQEVRCLNKDTFDKQENIDHETGLELQPGDDKDGPEGPSAPKPAADTEDGGSPTASSAGASPAPAPAPQPPIDTQKADDGRLTWYHFDITVYITVDGAYAGGDGAFVGRSVKCKLTELKLINGRASFVGEADAVEWMIGGARQPLTAFVPAAAEDVLTRATPSDAKYNAPMEDLKKACPQTLRHVRRIAPALDTVPWRYYTHMVRTVLPPTYPRYLSKSQMSRKGSKKHPYAAYEAMNVILPNAAPLTTVNYDRFSLSSGMFAGANEPEPEVVAAAAGAAPRVASFQSASVLPALLRAFLNAFAKHRTFEYDPQVSFIMTRQPREGFYHVYSKVAVGFLKRSEAEALERDAGTITRPMVRYAMKELLYHALTEPLGEGGGGDRGRGGAEVFEDPPFYPLSNPPEGGAPSTTPCVLLHQGARMVLKADEADARLFVASWQSLDIGPRWTETQVDFARVKGLYTTGRSTKRTISRLYGVPEMKKMGPAMPPQLQRETRHALSFLIDVLLQRKMMAAAGVAVPVEGMMRQYVTFPHDRLTALYAYKFSRLWLEGTAGFDLHRAADQEQPKPGETAFTSAWPQERHVVFTDRLVAAASTLVDRCADFLSQLGDGHFGFFRVTLENNEKQRSRDDPGIFLVDAYSCTDETMLGERIRMPSDKILKFTLDMQLNMTVTQDWTS
eukprot:TRINITY_DN6725_c0_g1_i1.p1 TRINITY_DN6725_c0_g1~~TRINITY_DN6725_c0_g1_i1.p1  ORF type:complete len:1156 (+),score=330.00 TRINITY_DN6725_c0_g1_i1:257-3469(+)